MNSVSSLSKIFFLDVVDLRRSRAVIEIQSVKQPAATISLTTPNVHVEYS